VSGELRSRSATESGAADDLVAQVRRLLAAGVPPSQVTVVGASVGAGITLIASARLQNKDLRFAVLGACLSESVRQILGGEGKAPSGKMLSVREASDESTQPCAAWSNSPGAPSLDAREIVLHTGLSHGFLYRPLPEWVDPTVQWAMAP
jgi:pimeloyl-ACP methyl ester carboxylesterase